MLKKLARTLSLASLLLSASSQALPIVQADAFVAGDNKAALETSTGLVWMDFGVNAKQNFTSDMLLADIVSNLGTVYKGWRLASEAEVTHLWFSLFGSQVVPVSNLNAHAYNLSDWDGVLLSHFHDIVDVFGYTWDSVAYTNKTGEPGGSDMFATKSGIAHFYTANNNIGYVHFYTPHSGVHLSTTTINLNDSVPPNFTFGAMLVKDTSVPEPSAFILLSLGLLGLRIARRTTK